MGAGGRPLKFNSAEELQEKIDAYFDSCHDEVWYCNKDEESGKETWTPKMDRHGNVVKKQIKPFTLSGLAVFLECDRKTLLNYSYKEEYFPTIKAAKTKVESYVEEQLLSGLPAAGPIFNLKNNFDDWKDKQEVDQTVANKPGESFNIATGMKELTVEELKKLAQSQPDGDSTA